MEKTLIIIKPDGMKRNLENLILGKFLDEGLIPKWEKRYQEGNSELKYKFREHYIDHKDKHFYKDLVECMSKGPIMVAMVEGEEAVSKGRKILEEVRKQYAEDFRNNTIHASDSVDNAKREIEV